MIKIMLKDGTVKEYNRGVTVLEAAGDISGGRSKRINGGS